jgi:hypothetical protein
MKPQYYKKSSKFTVPEYEASVLQEIKFTVPEYEASVLQEIK